MMQGPNMGYDVPGAEVSAWRLSNGGLFTVLAKKKMAPRGS